MNCTHCGKRLSRKSARLIDGVVMCSKCMFTPAKQRKPIAVDRNPEGQDRNGLGAQHESANSSEYFPNTPGTHTMTNTPNPGDQAVAVTQADRDWLCRELEAWRPDVCKMTGLPRGADVEIFADKLLHRLSAIPTPPADHTDLIAAVQTVIANKSGTYRARNGRQIGIEADDGEMCWIVHSDDMFALETAFKATSLLQAHASPREWQDIATAPSDGPAILVWGGRYKEPEVSLPDGSWWNAPSNAGLRSIPTHWMPMPTPPALELG